MRKKSRLISVLQEEVVRVKVRVERHYLPQIKPKVTTAHIARFLTGNKHSRNIYDCSKRKSNVIIYIQASLKTVQKSCSSRWPQRHLHLKNQPQFHVMKATVWQGQTAVLINKGESPKCVFWLSKANIYLHFFWGTAVSIQRRSGEVRGLDSWASGVERRMWRD